MKIYTILGEFLVFILVTVFCIVPPFFTSVQPNQTELFTQWTFPITQMSLFIFSLVVYIICKPIICTTINSSDKKNRKLSFLLDYIFSFIFCFCLLFCISLILKGISIILKNINFETSINVSKPETFTAWIFCILNFLFSAFFEECIYRFYFPQTLIHLIHFKSNKKLLDILIEIISCAVFAFGHLYLGWISVLNAALAHCLLRFFFKKTNTIIPLFAAHFCYNIISLILL